MVLQTASSYRYVGGGAYPAEVFRSYGEGRVKIGMSLEQVLGPLKTLTARFTQFSPQGKINYAVVGGMALALYMLCGFLEAKETADIDIYAFGTAPAPPQNSTADGFRVDVFSGPGPNMVPLREEDVNTIEIGGTKVAVIRPEAYLIAKVFSHEYRAKDLVDATWLLENMKLDDAYFDELIRSWRPDLVGRISLQRMRELCHDLSGLFRYVRSF